VTSLAAVGAGAEANVWIPGLIIIAGILGVVVPVIPGLIVALAGVLLWAIDSGTMTGWVVFGSASPCMPRA
jgi:uncharacterized protein YqgC (DUF456 family)